MISALVHAQPAGPVSDAKSEVAPFYTTETVVVDEVLRLDDNGFRSNAYVATWNNSRVAVEDTLSRTNYRVGDKIKVLVTRLQVGSDPKMRLLHFMVVPESKCTKQSQPVAPPDAPASAGRC